MSLQLPTTSLHRMTLPLSTHSHMQYGNLVASHQPSMRLYWISIRSWHFAHRHTERSRFWLWLHSSTKVKTIYGNWRFVEWLTYFWIAWTTIAVKESTKDCSENHTEILLVYIFKIVNSTSQYILSTTCMVVEKPSTTKRMTYVWQKFDITRVIDYKFHDVSH